MHEKAETGLQKNGSSGSGVKRWHIRQFVHQRVKERSIMSTCRQQWWGQAGGYISANAVDVVSRSSILRKTIRSIMRYRQGAMWSRNRFPSRTRAPNIQPRSFRSIFSIYKKARSPWNDGMAHTKPWSQHHRGCSMKRQKDLRKSTSTEDLWLLLQGVYNNLLVEFLQKLQLYPEELMPSLRQRVFMPSIVVL